MRLSDLPEDVVEEIFSRVPPTSLSAVRSTCKKWYDLSKTHILGKAAWKQFLGFTIMDYKVCSMRFDLQGIRNNDLLVNPSIKEIGLLNELNTIRVFHCDGLLLCEVMHDSKLVVWNPYLGQTRWIPDDYASYSSDMYALGCDKNHNHKIWRSVFHFTVVKQTFLYQIYDFSSNSWRDLDLPFEWEIELDQRYVSSKGNAYFLAQMTSTKSECFMLCFDFTAERFGPRLPLPFHSYVKQTVTLSCVREEQLAVLYQSRGGSMEIWITNNIDPNAVSWSKFLNVKITTVAGFPFHFEAGSFFIDEEKKIAVVFHREPHKWYEAGCCQTAHIIGEDGCIKSVAIGDATELGHQRLVFSCYVPSLVQLQIKQSRKRKERGC